MESINKNSTLCCGYLFEDLPAAPGCCEDYEGFTFMSHGCRLFGQLMKPDPRYTGPHPCFILCHGFPGTARNDDIAFALARIGCVTITFHFRGAWGSEGKYLVSNCGEDIAALYELVRTEEFCARYHTSPDAVFILGHSMAGYSVLHAADQLSGLRGMILMAPFDAGVLLRAGDEARLRWVLQEPGVLHCDGRNAIYEDLVALTDNRLFTDCADSLRQHNTLLLAAGGDTIAPPTQMVQPLNQALSVLPSTAIHRCVTFPNEEHGLLGCRRALIQTIADFLRDCL